MEENDLIKKINKQIPEAKAVPMKEFYDIEISGGIWFKGSEDIADGIMIFNGHETFLSDTQGIHPTLYKILDDAGWYGQPYDTGTLMAYEI
tara:strand:+ start:251 stop:523 length:273 start_codon:yes stop_codon:yes gene_type:complete